MVQRGETFVPEAVGQKNEQMGKIIWNNTYKNYTEEELYTKGIRVIRGNKVFTESVAEIVIAYVLNSLPYG